MVFVIVVRFAYFLRKTGKKWGKTSKNIEKRRKMNENHRKTEGNEVKRRKRRGK